MGEIVKHETKAPALQVSKEKLMSYLDMFGHKDLAPEQKEQFIDICVMNSLNPFKREAHVSKYKRKDGGYDFTVITGYEVYIKRAEASGRLDGWETPTISRCKTVSVDQYGQITEIEDIKATITIHRKDWTKPFTHSVKLSEYIQKTYEGFVTKFWRKAESQLKKVAISQGFRLCFNEILGGMPYTQEEYTNYSVIETKEEIKEPEPVVIETNPEPEPVAKKTLSDERFDKALSQVASNPIEIIEQILTFELTDEQTVDLTSHIEIVIENETNPENKKQLREFWENKLSELI